MRDSAGIQVVRERERERECVVLELWFGTKGGGGGGGGGGRKGSLKEECRIVDTR